MGYFDIDIYHRPVTTSSDDAQLWFNRGLTWCYGYYLEEAARCFEKSIAADPGCAMAHWGFAYSTGPNYNLPWDRQTPAMQRNSLSACHAATQAALALRDHATPVEQALIDALAHRFPQPDPRDLDTMAGWNRDFTEAMRTVFAAYREDRDVRALFVEAILNNTPWEMWDQATGQPAAGAGTLEAQQVLEEALEKDAGAMTHPGLLHLYVHLMEMSPTPEKALKAGDVLRTLVPGAGHLIHMPTHIDVQCGDYQSVVHWNLAAAKVDRQATDLNGLRAIYTGYCVHNLHFAAYGAMFLGQLAPALEACDLLEDLIPEDLLRDPALPFADILESYLSIRVHVLIRFGRWQEIIDRPLPEDRELYANLAATLHYAKGVAHAALGQTDRARAEQTEFEAARTRIPRRRRLHNVLCSQQQAVATEMLEGEILYREGAFDGAFARLRAAVALEDALPYDEPWGWMQPVRHALGALTLEQGRVDEAEATYREDLGLGGSLPRAQTHPDNIWALRGLFDCLKERGKADSDEGRLIAQRLALAQARADRPVAVSCFCAGMGRQ